MKCWICCDQATLAGGQLSPLFAIFSCICGDVVIISKRFWGSWLFQFSSRGLLYGRKFLPQSSFCESWKGFQTAWIEWLYRLWVQVVKNINFSVSLAELWRKFHFRTFWEVDFWADVNSSNRTCGVFNRTTSLSRAVFLSRFVDLIVVVNLVDHGLWTTP